jgi:hypothetical protein
MNASPGSGEQGALRLNERQSVGRLLLGAFDLYRRYSLLFFVLAAGVIVPYKLIVLAATGAGPFSGGTLAPGVSILLTLIDLALIGPLISALHVHAVAEVRRGEDPRIGAVVRQGFRVLPVVAAAAIVSWLGILVGYAALIVPGVILTLRWIVVAQAAAIEHEGWLPALRRSGELSDGQYGHVFAFFVSVAVIVLVPSLLGAAVFGEHDTGAVSFLVGLVVHIFPASFDALATALLFYDLLARQPAHLRRTRQPGIQLPDETM